MKKVEQVAILGLGVFGSELAETLSQYGVEVLAADIDSACVERVAQSVTKAAVADITDKDQLLELGVNEFDVVIVAASEHFEESVLCTMILKEFGVPYIIAKARNKRKSMILEKVGANKVINSEKDMAHRVAKSLTRRSIVDLVELDAEYSIVEIRAPHEWYHKSLRDLNVRSAFGMNIIGVKPNGSAKMSMDFDASYVVNETDHFLVVAKTEAIEKWDYLTK